MKKRLIYFYKILPESMITFISGIFISVSTGIFTCAIPNSITTIGVCYIISAVLMFLASLALMVWAIIIQGIHAGFAQDSLCGLKSENPDWCKYITDGIRRKEMTIINVCFIVTSISVLSSIILWVIA